MEAVDEESDAREADPAAPPAAAAGDRVEVGDARPVVAHLDELMARMPGDTAGALIGPLVGGCDVAAVAARRDLVEARFGALRGARRRIDQAYERVDQCAARKAAVAPALAAWLAGMR